jgi:hypothetical protein
MAVAKFPHKAHLRVKWERCGQTIAEANQVLFFYAAEGYRVSHPIPGGDGSLLLAISPELLFEMGRPYDFLRWTGSSTSRVIRPNIQAL